MTSLYDDPSREMRRRKQRIAITYAMTTPLAAGTLVITVVLGVVLLLLGYFLLGALFFVAGLVFYALIVLGTLRDEEQIRRVLIEELYPERSADLRKLRGRYATIMQEALDDRKRIERAMRESPEAIQRALSDTMEQVGAITDTVYEIAYKSQSLEESLAPVDVAREQQEVARLTQAIQREKDSYLRQQYQATLETKQELLENMARIRNGLERWNAQLQRAATTLDNLYSQVLMIRSAEIRNLTEATDVVSQSLRQQVEELRLTSKAMDEVFSQ
jgi:hypothetical protein